MRIKHATKRLIDSVWTLSYSESPEGITIHTYDRENDIGYEQENSLPRCRLIEDKQRMVKNNSGE